MAHVKPDEETKKAIEEAVHIEFVPAYKRERRYKPGEVQLFPTASGPHTMSREAIAKLKASTRKR